MDREKAEKLADGVINIVKHHESVAEEYSRELENALIHSEGTLDVINDYFEEALDQAEGPGSHYTSSPYEEVPRSMMNAVGSVYPHLDRDEKDRAVDQILEFLDGQNYVYVNGAAGSGYTPGIDEPLLLADISIVRPRYWPGLNEAERLIDEYSSEEGKLVEKDNYDELKDDLFEQGGLITEEVNSQFLVSYALMREDYSDFNQDFARELDSEFLDRTLKGITALRFGLFADDEESGMERLENLMPKNVHEEIWDLKDQDFWIEEDKF